MLGSSAAFSGFAVDDIDAAVDALAARGVRFQASEWTDEKGMARGIAAGRGPDIRGSPTRPGASSRS